jgi:hypothetical protein
MTSGVESRCAGRLGQLTRTRWAMRKVGSSALLVAVLAALSCRKGAASKTDSARPSSSETTSDQLQPAYESAADAFRVSYPLKGAPRVIVDPPVVIEHGHLAGTRTTRVSYYVAQGDLTFLVEVRRYSKTSLSDASQWRDWALAEMRANAKRLLEERTVSTLDPGGAKVVGVQALAEMPSGVRAHNTVFFYGNRMYSIGVAPAALTDAPTYERFLRSFVLLDQARAAN